MSDTEKRQTSPQLDTLPVPWSLLVRSVLVSTAEKEANRIAQEYVTTYLRADEHTQANVLLEAQKRLRREAEELYDAISFVELALTEKFQIR